MKEEGWYLHLIYLAVSSAKVSESRVAERVSKGGHDVPTKDIERRYPRSLQNLFGDYSEIMDTVWCHWNEEKRLLRIFEKEDGSLTILNPILYHFLQEQCQK